MLSFLRNPKLQAPLEAPDLLDRDHSILAFNERVLTGLFAMTFRCWSVCATCASFHPILTSFLKCVPSRT
jgi:hypothetical protein